MTLGSNTVLGKMLRVLLSMREDQIVSEQQCAQGDACVCDVEGGPVILTRVDMNEVDHKSQPHTVCQISHDAGQQQRTCAKYPIVVALGAKEVEQHCDGSRGC